MGITRNAAHVVADYGNPRSIGARLRARRLGVLLGLIDECFQLHGKVDIIDIGGTRAYWIIVPREILEEKQVTITIVNLPGVNPPAGEPRFKYLEGDACNLSKVRDGSFEIAHSNSVVEHVGDWARMMEFAAEVARVGDRYLVQTPYFWFPIEPHVMTPFFHWLPKPVRVTLVQRFSLGNWAREKDLDRAVRRVEGARLLDRKMFRELFPDARILTERILLLPKSLLAVR